MRILCDMDGVVMDIMSSWLRMYNQDYDDSLTVDDIISRDIEKYVKPECGNGIYEYPRMKGFFRQAQLYPEAQDGIQKLFETEDDIWFIATPLPDTEYFLQETTEWVEEHFPQIGSKNIIFCLDKGIIGGHVLIDDIFENFNSFCGLKVLFERPWNQHFTPARLSDINDSQCFKTGNWEDIIDVVKLLGVLI